MSDIVSFMLSFIVIVIERAILSWSFSCSCNLSGSGSWSLT